VRSSRVKGLPDVAENSPRVAIDCEVHYNGSYVLTLSVISIWPQLTILLAFMNTPILFMTSKLGVHDVASQ